MSDHAVNLGDPATAAPSSATAPAVTPSHASTLAEVIEIADDYRGSTTLLGRAHNIEVEKYQDRNSYLGIPASIIAAVVGSSSFASLSSDEQNFFLTIITGALAILAAVLSALQTFLKYSEIALAHKAAKDGYESVRRKIDLFKLQASGATALARPDAGKALHANAA